MTELQTEPASWSQQQASAWLDQACRRRDPHARLVRRPRRWYSSDCSAGRRGSIANLTDGRACEALARAISVAAEADGSVQVAPSFSFYDGVSRGVEHFIALRLNWRKPIPTIVDPSPIISGYLWGRPFSLRELSVVAQAHELDLPPQLQPEVDVLSADEENVVSRIVSVSGNPAQLIVAERSFAPRLFVNGVRVLDDESDAESF